MSNRLTPSELDEVWEETKTGRHGPLTVRPLVTEARAWRELGETPEAVRAQLDIDRTTIARLRRDCRNQEASIEVYQDERDLCSEQVSALAETCDRLEAERDQLRERVLDLEQGCHLNQARCSECDEKVMFLIECKDHRS